MVCPDCGKNLDAVPVDRPCPRCGSGRRDAVVSPPTVAAVAAAYNVMIGSAVETDVALPV